MKQRKEKQKWWMNLQFIIKCPFHSKDRVGWLCVSHQLCDKAEFVINNMKQFLNIIKPKKTIKQKETQQQCEQSCLSTSKRMKENTLNYRFGRAYNTQEAVPRRELCKSHVSFSSKLYLEVCDIVRVAIIAICGDMYRGDGAIVFVDKCNMASRVVPRSNARRRCIKLGYALQFQHDRLIGQRIARLSINVSVSVSHAYRSTYRSAYRAPIVKGIVSHDYYLSKRKCTIANSNVHFNPTLCCGWGVPHASMWELVMAIGGLLDGTYVPAGRI